MDYALRTLIAILSAASGGRITPRNATDGRRPLSKERYPTKRVISEVEKPVFEVAPADHPVRRS